MLKETSLKFRPTLHQGTDTTNRAGSKFQRFEPTNEKALQPNRVWVGRGLWGTAKLYRSRVIAICMRGEHMIARLAEM